MPKWGLTAAMRRTGPWQLADEWLDPGKVVTDPVHGDIYLTALEVAIVESRAFQRLRRVRQLGNTHLVYPGATHTRFAHSLGAVKVAQDLVDTVVDQRSGRDPKHDLFEQWEAELGTRTPDGRYELQPDDAREFDKRIAEVTILARLGALLHDLCHVPFGHSVEDDLGILTAHDKNEHRFQRLWSQLPGPVQYAIGGADDLQGQLQRLILSKLKYPDKPRYAFVEDIVGNTICADLLDYLRRDHLFMGLPLALGERFAAGYYVLPDGDPEYERRMVLSVARQGEERIDAITEILKHLRYRYELSERGLIHHAKLAADAMVGKALEMWHDALWVEAASDEIAGDGPDAPEWPAGDDRDAVRAALSAVGGKPRALDRRIRRQLDDAMTMRGDDGLLEYLADLPTQLRGHVRHCDIPRRKAVASVAQALLARQLYKRVAIQHHTRKDRYEFYKQHGGAAERRRVEERAAHFAGVRPAWNVLVWLPDPRMRLKVAGVLVDDGTEISRFVDREENGKKRGADIYAAHRNLWAVSVYVHPSLRDDTARIELLLASLAADLDIILSAELAREFGPSPYEWPDRIALRELATQVDEGFQDFEIEELLARRLHKARSARRETGRPSLRALISEYRRLLG